MSIKRKLINSSRGFTLIELLIVIAVLGVLAAVVLMAIDPLEQLARGRDTGRLSDVAQLGHAVQGYYTAQQAQLSAWTSPVAPTAFTNANWQDILVASGDIAKAVTAPTTGSSCVTAGATSPSSEGSFCYGENGASNQLIWTVAESKLDKAKASCTAAQYAVFVYDTGQGKAGVGCAANAQAPAAGLTLK